MISKDLYPQIKGLGGLRNQLVHQYAQIDLDIVFSSFHKSLRIFPLYAKEIFEWMNIQEK
ncbi:MAG: HepT-like ribonuclease domain-containing protein [Methanothrix sp.]